MRSHLALVLLFPIVPVLLLFLSSSPYLLTLLQQWRMMYPSAAREMPGFSCVSQWLGFLSFVLSLPLSMTKVTMPIDTFTSFHLPQNSDRKLLCQNRSSSCEALEFQAQRLVCRYVKVALAAETSAAMASEKTFPLLITDLFGLQHLLEYFIFRSNLFPAFIL